MFEGGGSHSEMQVGSFGCWLEMLLWFLSCLQRQAPELRGDVEFDTCTIV